jgi:hypothetical protein
MVGLKRKIKLSNESELSDHYWFSICCSDWGDVQSFSGPVFNSHLYFKEVYHKIHKGRKKGGRQRF